MFSRILASAWLGVLFGGTAGCRGDGGNGPDAIFIVRGIGGATAYDRMADLLRQPRRAALVVTWGAPTPLFFVNFSNPAIHAAAERDLAGKLCAWHLAHTDGRIDLVGHSAGCGLILGALARLPQSVAVSTVILLAPSVSPTYDPAQPSRMCFERFTAFTARATRHF